jgi:hypothetical protein
MAYVQRGSQVVQFRMDDRALQHLREMRQAYGALLGQRVSNSAVLRRAVALLHHFMSQEFDAEAEANSILNAHNNRSARPA